MYSMSTLSSYLFRPEKSNLVITTKFNHLYLNSKNILFVISKGFQVTRQGQTQKYVHAKVLEPTKKQSMQQSNLMSITSSIMSYRIERTPHNKELNPRGLKRARNKHT